MSNGVQNCLTGVCCDDGEWKMVRKLANFLEKHSADEGGPYYEPLERAAAALLKEYGPLAPAGVNRAIVEGYRKIFFEEFQRQQAGAPTESEE